MTEQMKKIIIRIITWLYNKYARKSLAKEVDEILENGKSFGPHQLTELTKKCNECLESNEFREMFYGRMSIEKMIESLKK